MNRKKTASTYIAGAILILGIVGFLLLRKHTAIAPSSSTIPNISTNESPKADLLPGLQTGPIPWDTSLTHLKDRLTAISLPALSAEGTVMHTHQHIDISIEGKSVDVPAGIGVNESAGFISPIHTHDTTGIIHVESPTVQTFTLGQFFDIWGVRLTSVCIGGYCASENENLKVYVHGKLYQGNPRDIELTPHEEIYVFYGTAKQMPKVIPSTYTFPQGY